MDALTIPSAFVLLCLVKKLTVSGIIGKIQGMIRAAKPPKKPSQKVVPKPSQGEGSGASTISVLKST
ncbi:MAG: Uncharacterised protein [Cryomorphaceae bacterium]|nr:MAG: Uncharacterised protein [Cryomorphaceae bacterium]